MRLKLELVPTKNDITIQLNYNYYLSTAIYRFLQKADEEFSKQLKEEGFRSGSKTMKLFTFSELLIPKNNFQLRGDKLKILNRPSIGLFVGTFRKEFFFNFVRGVFLKQQLFIGHPENSFEVSRVESLEEPVFENGVSYGFKPLSSIFLSKKTEDGKTLHLTNEHEDYGFFLKRNLDEKFRIAFGTEPPPSKFDFFWDEIPPQTKRVTKLIKIKNISKRTMFHSFHLKAHPELLKLGYDCGFGGQNSEGFGMVSLNMNDK